LISPLNPLATPARPSQWRGLRVTWGRTRSIR
jgi:hypothetical protein